MQIQRKNLTISNETGPGFWSFFCLGVLYISVPVFSTLLCWWNTTKKWKKNCQRDIWPRRQCQKVSPAGLRRGKFSSFNPLSIAWIWLLTRNHYGISALGRQRKSFRNETSGGVAKCRLFSEADVHHFQDIHGVYSLSPSWIFASEKKEWNLGQIERVLHQINLSVDASEIFWLLEKALREIVPLS